jgi:hypothetical protein
MILGVLSVEILKNGVSMFRNVKIVTLGLLAIVSWIVLYTVTVRYWLGI